MRSKIEIVTYSIAFIEEGAITVRGVMPADDIGPFIEANDLKEGEFAVFAGTEKTVKRVTVIEDATAAQLAPAKKKKRGGRPKGSRNRPKDEPKTVAVPPTNGEHKEAAKVDVVQS